MTESAKKNWFFEFESKNAGDLRQKRNQTEKKWKRESNGLNNRLRLSREEFKKRDYKKNMNTFKFGIRPINKERHGKRTCFTTKGDKRSSKHEDEKGEVAKRIVQPKSQKSGEPTKEFGIESLTRIAEENGQWRKVGKSETPTLEGQGGRAKQLRRTAKEQTPRRKDGKRAPPPGGPTQKFKNGEHFQN